MPYSLRVKLKKLQYKGIITDKDCVRLCKALDNECVLDKIREEIEELYGKHVVRHCVLYGPNPKYIPVSEVLRIIDKNKTEIEYVEEDEELIIDKAQFEKFNKSIKKVERGKNA